MVFASGGNGKEDDQSRGGGGGIGEIPIIIYYDATYKTNLDRIRAMDIDGLIEWYCRGRPCGSCPYNGVECGIREWLNEVTDND